jgi:hypothetical protein
MLVQSFQFTKRYAVRFRNHVSIYSLLGVSIYSMGVSGKSSKISQTVVFDARPVLFVHGLTLLQSPSRLHCKRAACNLLPSFVNTALNA